MSQDIDDFKHEADLLHPLATLHWERCRVWDWNFNVTHCVALDGIVCIATSTLRGHCDRVLISTDLHSWNVATLPCYGMSLTTYQSKFVAIGGENPATLESTNKLWTSDTGQDWLPSLPPMPSKCYMTLSIGITSPECLVVAGGRTSDFRYVDVVEVLQGKQWSLVGPSPSHNIFMKSTLHNGNLYLLTYTSVLFTCSLSSLISECKEPGKYSETRLWNRLSVPMGCTSMASFGSRLIAVSDRLQGYSNTSTYSWVDISSTGDIPDVTGSRALNVLPTGKLIFACQQGVYTVTLSVSIFDPDSMFITNVLDRLEAVMGISIVSKLDAVSRKLATAIGFPAKELHHLARVIMIRWSNGLGSCSPLWKHLFEVFEKVGLLKLGQQIEAFLKGETRYVDAYHHFISTKDSLDMLFLKFIFLGPPRLGKTTARRRLTGEIIDLKSAGEAELSCPSTGVIDARHSVVVRQLSSTAAVVTESEWSALQSIPDEARMLFHTLVDSLDAKPMALASASKPSEHKHIIDNIEKTDSESTASQLASLPQPVVTTSLENKTPLDSSMSNTAVQADMLDFNTIFKEAMGSEYWKDVKHIFKAYLRMEDTGGQPELMDMLPALTIGPGLYLLFMNLENDLHERYCLSYCTTSGESTPPVESTYTVEEMMLSALSSISCSNTYTSSIHSEKTSNSDLNKILQSSKSVAYIVGTHVDKLPSKDSIKKIDAQLQSLIKSTDFYDKDIVQFYSKEELIIPMNNMEGGAEEVKRIQKLLERGMDRHFKKIPIPVVWLFFSLSLRRKNVRTANLDFCLKLSRQLNMSPYETKVALWFLHHHAGVMMFFPNIPELKDLVIVDVQVVYDSVTILIIKAMKFDEVGHKGADEFERTGQFELDRLIAATANVSGDYIPPQKLVALLEFLHIIARIDTSQLPSPLMSSNKKLTYIMPCILKNVSKGELDSMLKSMSQPDSVSPILVHYKCGFVPIGVFPAMIASLIANNSFKLVRDGIKKNFVKFRFGKERTLVALASQPKYYKICISRLPEASLQLNEECVAIRKNLESTIEKVFSRLNYGCFMDYQFAFKCPIHPESDHLCVVNKEEEEFPLFMDCLSNCNNPHPVQLKCCHQVWYAYEENALIASSDSSACEDNCSMLKKWFPRLVMALQPHIGSATDECWSKDLISEETYDAVMDLNLTNADKARRLLKNVWQTISCDPQVFEKFRGIVDKLDGCGGIMDATSEPPKAKRCKTIK